MTDENLKRLIMEKQEWKKPILTVIKRDKPEENVLLNCSVPRVCGPESHKPTS